MTGLGGGLVRTLEALGAFLDHHDGQGVVIGGIAVIASGVPRVTRDVDVAFAAGRIALPALVKALAAVGVAARIPDAEAFAAESQVLLMRHVSAGVDVDLSLAWLPFESSTRPSPGAPRTSKTSSACSRSTATGWISTASAAASVSWPRRWRWTGCPIWMRSCRGCSHAPDAALSMSRRRIG